MTAVLAHSGYMTLRGLRALWRQPWFVAITLIQPIIWLLLFGALFKRVIDIPGFTSGSYLDFLAPGIVVMSSLFSGGWNGMGMLNDLDRGVVDRFLVSPARRGALIAGPLGGASFVIAIQSAIIVLIGIAAGARFPGGVVGIIVLILVSVFLGTAMGALSNALALLARKEETVIAAVQFVVLPMSFLSTAFMQRGLVPGWIGDIARFNPANWAVEAGREALGDNVDWSIVLSRAAFLVAFAAACALLATRAFRSYQRSV